MSDRQTAAPEAARDTADAAPPRAGAFDIRNVIAGLIGCYGVVLVALGLVADDPAARDKTGDVNANLWAGLGMVGFAVAFVVWARLRPVVVEPPPERADGDAAH
jgi:hypothetical protein